VDVDAAVLAHARRLARDRRLSGRARFRRADLRELGVRPRSVDAVLLIYYVLENFPRSDQARVLRGLRRTLEPGGRLIAELRLRPDQPPGRSDWWDIVPSSLLSDRRHLLLGDAMYDPRRNTYVMREVAVFDDGTMSVLQTSGWLCPFDSIPSFFATAGLVVTAIHDGWSRRRATQLSETVLVVAEAVS
jgi:SAM-dependent methyltransferase